MKRKKITLVGYYGYDNLGDDLMLQCLLETLTKFHPRLHIEVLARKSENIKLIVNGYENVSLKFFRTNSKIANIKLYLTSIFSSDLTVWGGGTCFSDEDGIGNFRYFLLNCLLFRRFTYIGVGIGNIRRQSSIRKTKILLKMMSFATFRDEKSYVLANQISSNKNIFLTSDLSYAFDISKYRSSKNKERYILVSLRELEGYFDSETLNERHEAILRFICELAIKGDYKLVFLPIDSVKDHNINHHFALKIKNKYPDIAMKLSELQSYENKIQLIAGATLNLTERLHSAVLSKLLKTPCIALSYSPKINRFHQEIGSNLFVSHETKLTYNLLLDIYNSLENEKNIQKEISKNLEKLRLSSYRNVELLNNYL